MFKQGSLWYDFDLPDVLVTHETLYPADKGSHPLPILESHVWPPSNGGRRIPMHPDQLNSSNIICYKYIPGYGYWQEWPIKEPPAFFYYDRFKTR